MSGNRSALSLLEVMLALAILGGSLAVISQLYAIGARQAIAARDLTEAEMWCEEKLAEISAGSTAPEPVSDAPLDEEGKFVYSVEKQDLNDQGMISVTVTVRLVPSAEEASLQDNKLKYSLTRWMVDPEIEAAAIAQAASDDAL